MGKSLVSLFFLTHSVDLNDELPFALNQVANRISSSDMAVVTLSQKTSTYFLTTDIKKSIDLIILAQRGGSVAEWLAWTQAQKGQGSNRSRDVVG